MGAQEVEDVAGGGVNETETDAVVDQNGEMKTQSETTPMKRQSERPATSRNGNGDDERPATSATRNGGKVADRVVEEIVLEVEQRSVSTFRSRFVNRLGLAPAPATEPEPQT